MKTYLVFILLFISLAFSLPGQAQLISVSGYVKNYQTGETKINATVLESVSGVGTITNSQGYYRLLLRPGHRKIEYSSPDFNAVTTEFKLVTDTVLSVELVPLEMQNLKVAAAKSNDTVQVKATRSGKTSGKRSVK